MAKSRTNLYFSPELVSVRTYKVESVSDGGNLIKLTSRFILDNKYTDNMSCIFVAKQTNTGPVQIQIGGLEPKRLVNKLGQELLANEITASDVYQVIYIGDRENILYDKFVLAALGGNGSGGIEVFPTKNDMIQSLKLRENSTVLTLGEVSEDDGKANFYYIQSRDSGNDILLENGKYAHRILTEALQKAINLELALSDTNKELDDLTAVVNNFKTNQELYNQQTDEKIQKIKNDIITINNNIEQIITDNSEVNQKVSDLFKDKTDVGYIYGGDLSEQNSLSENTYYRDENGKYVLNLGGNREWNSGNGTIDDKFTVVSFKTLLEIINRGPSDLLPNNPTAGSIYYDTDNKVLKVFNGTNWGEIEVDSTSGKLRINKVSHGFSTGDVLAFENGEWVLADLSNRVDTDLLLEGKAICVKINENEFFAVLNGMTEYTESILDTEGNELESESYYLVSNKFNGKLTKDMDGIVYQTAVYVLHINNKKYMEVLLSQGMTVSDDSIDGNGVMSYSVVVNQPNHGFIDGDALFFNGVGWELADISNIDNLKQIKAICLKIDNNKFRALLGGVHKLNVDLKDVNGLSLTPGEFYFLSITNPGKVSKEHGNHMASQVAYHCIQIGTSKYIDLVFNQGVEFQDMNFEDMFVTEEEARNLLGI